ncbi:MAG TPA: DUF3626 domain-containing protein [Micromonospora sp.]|nr:DUF3626 domain-containing protein [Micromonospora sp.]
MHRAEEAVWARAVEYVAARSAGHPISPELRVTINFHPDRLTDGYPILTAMRRDGHYRSQFETGTSNGGLTAYPGGDRWKWESRMFGSTYDDAPAADRPKYGALNHRRRPVGGSPRFGSAHFRLRPQVLARTTFCYPDSHLDPTDFGVSQQMSLIALADADTRDLLDDYIEAQVHGPLRLDQDVEALVLDPCFQNTAVEELAHRLPCPVEWHPGLRLGVDTLVRRPDYRGQTIVDCGRTLAKQGYLDARIIGEAVNAGRYDEQTLKRVWHYVARFGESATAPLPQRDARH